MPFSFPSPEKAPECTHQFDVNFDVGKLSEIRKKNNFNGSIKMMESFNSSKNVFYFVSFVCAWNRFFWVEIYSIRELVVIGFIAEKVLAFKQSG